MNKSASDPRRKCSDESETRERKCGELRLAYPSTFIVSLTSGPLSIADKALLQFQAFKNSQHTTPTHSIEETYDFGVLQWISVLPLLHEFSIN